VTTKDATAKKLPVFMLSRCKRCGICSHFCPEGAIAEVDDQDLWQKAHLGVCSLGNDRRQVNGRLDQVINFIERLQVAVDIDTHIELLDY